MSKIKEIENEGRFKLTTTFPNIEWKFTDYSEVFDAETTKGNKKIIAEIKVRDFPHWQYATAILEAEKLEKLQDEKADTIIYVNHYTNGFTATWNLSKTDFNLIESNSFLCDKYTLAPSNKVFKKMYYLPIKDADLRKTATGIKVQPRPKN